MSDHLRPSDSAHPDEALVGLVDGTLTAAERADLQAHLDGCERCRSEVALAASAARALRALPELDAPWGLGREAIEEARTWVRPARSRRWAAVAGVAAATVLVVGLSVAVLRGPQDQGPNAAGVAPRATTGATSNDSGAGKAFAPAGPVIVKSTQNFDARSVADLASTYSEKAGRHPQSKPTPPPQPLASPAGTSAGVGVASLAPAPSVAPTGESGTNPGQLSGTSSANDRAFAIGPVACVDAAAGYSASTMPVRVIDARFEEKPALIGIFLQGPGAGRPAGLVVIWVASHDCHVLSYASHSVTP